MDNIFGIGLPELFFIAILALIILGPERLPSTLRQIARYWGYMRNLGRELTSQFSEEFKALEDLNPRKILNEMADEEMAKGATSKPATPQTKAATKPATSNTTANAKPTATKSTTTTGATAPKPASSTAATTANKSTATAKKTTNKPATAAGQKATEPAAASPTDAENTILPPAQEEASALPAPTNGDTPQLPKDSPALPPAEDAKTEPHLMISAAPASLNGNADSAEKEA